MGSRAVGEGWEKKDEEAQLERRPGRRLMEARRQGRGLGVGVG